LARPFGRVVAPAAGDLVLYTIGPGFGESQVVLLPDGRTLVVDVCVHNGCNLTVALLRALGRTKVDLLVVTHSDLDHIRGLPGLVSAFRPDRAWQFPGAGDLRALMAKWLRKQPGDRRLEELACGLEALDVLADENTAIEVACDTRSWPDETGPYAVHCLAPTQHDQVRNRRHLDDLLEWDGSKLTLPDRITQFLGGRHRGLATRPNVLSVALAIEWGSVRVVLGGDVEAGDGTDESGWRGVVSLLRRRGRLHLIEKARVVKVSHHGSKGAYVVEVWQLHARAAGETVAVVAPFRRGNVALPDDTFLSEVRAHAGHLILTSDGHGAHVRARAAGWSVSKKGPPCQGPLGIVTVRADGGIGFLLGRQALSFDLSVRRNASPPESA